MALIDSVRSEMMAAMKEHNTVKKEALSALLAALKSKAIDKRGDRTAEEESAVGQREGKKQKETIEKAKKLLMARNHFSEEEAHRYIQKTSMDSGTNMVEMAEMILSMM